MVLPGFHDSHIHPISGGMRALSCSLVEARTIDAILAKVRECAARPRSDDAGMADRRRLGPLAVSRGEPSPIDARRRRSGSTGVPRGRRRSLGVGQLESARDRRHRPLDTGSAQRRDRARPRQRRAQRHPARERGGAGLQAIAAAFGRRPSRRAATRPAVGGELRHHGDDRSRRRPATTSTPIRQPTPRES